MIKATLKVAGRTHTAKGKTAQDALSSLEPRVYRSVGVLTLEKRKKRQERVLHPMMMNRLFGPNSNLGKEVAVKQVSLLFDL